MGEPGFWDDPEAAGQGQRRARARDAPPETFARLRADVDDLDGLVELAEEDQELAAELERAARLGRVAPRRARGGAAVLRPLRRRRRARDRQRRRRRHRRPGLGRDGAADGDALGRAARLQGRAARGERGGGGRHQVGHVPRRGRERLRPVRRREGRAPARAHLAVRRRPPPPDVVRGRRGRAGRRGRRRGRDRRRRPADRHLPRLAAPAASTSTRPTRRCASRTGRPGIVVQCQNERSQSANKATAMAMLRSKLVELRGARAPRGDRQGEAARRRTSTSARRSAPTSCTRTRWSRTTAPTSRWATPSACSTATSTASSAPTCSQASARAPATTGRRERPSAFRRAAVRAVPRRAGRLRQPRARALPRARPQGRPGRRKTCKITGAAGCNYIFSGVESAWKKLKSNWKTT